MIEHVYHYTDVEDGYAFHRHVPAKGVKRVTIGARFVNYRVVYRLIKGRGPMLFDAGLAAQRHVEDVLLNLSVAEKCAREAINE